MDSPQVINYFDNFIVTIILFTLINFSHNLNKYLGQQKLDYLLRVRYSNVQDYKNAQEKKKEFLKAISIVSLTLHWQSNIS